MSYNKNLSITFGDEMRKKRKEINNMSQDDLIKKFDASGNKKLSVSMKTFSKWENGGLNNVHIMCDISQILDIDLPKLIADNLNERKKHNK